MYNDTMAPKEKKIGIVFGVFDGLHPGHEFLLSESLKLCEELIVVLTLSETALSLKYRAPKYSYKDREQAIKKWDGRIRIIPSDANPRTWNVFKKIEFDPHVHTVILGYDQSEIARELDRIKIPYTTLPSFHPEKYKSSLLNKD
jgi:cytidyltransferase-like protein